MIDGFGWFKEPDYRRSWLFFDQVEYILPESAEGPLIYPHWVLQRSDFKVVYPTFATEEITKIVESAARDADDPGFRQLVEGIVPAKDLDYAVLVLASDRFLRQGLPRDRKQDGVFALAVLINKLIASAALAGAVPIVGRQYASQLIAKKVEMWAGREPTRQYTPLADPKRALSFAGFAASLSLDFLSDDMLVSVSMDRPTVGALLLSYRAGGYDVS